MLVTRQMFDRVKQGLDAGEFDTNNIHTAMAAYVYGIPTRQVTNEQRQEAKQANYVWLYSRQIS